MHPCPCCGYKTLPNRGFYDLCPVCWWEDDGEEAWQWSGPNATTLVDAQQQYLAEERPYRLREGKVRAPRKVEARDPEWQPIALSKELLDRARRARQENEAQEREQQERARELEDDPAGHFEDFNNAIADLREHVPSLRHRQVREQVREISFAHGLLWPDAVLDLMSRQLHDEHFYRRHPLHAAWWVLRYSRPGSYLRHLRHLRELRTGDITVAGIAVDPDS